MLRFCRNSRERLWSVFPVEIRWLLNRIRPLLGWHLASFLCISTGSLLALLTPLILKWLIDAIIPQHQVGLLFCAVALMFLSYQGRTALNSLGTYLMVTAALKLGLTLRMNLLQHLNTLSADFYDQTPVGTAIYSLKEPVDEISYFGSDLLPAILRALLTTGFTLATMAALSPVLTVAVIPLIPMYVITRQYYRKRLLAAADAMQIDRVAWTDFVQEHLASVVCIQLLGQERRQERRAFRLMARSVQSQQRLERTGIWFSIFSSVAVATGMCTVIAYGGHSVLTGKLSVGGLVAFYGFLAQLFDPLSGAAELYARTQKILTSVRRVQFVLAQQSKVKRAHPPVFLTKDHDHGLVFTNVLFGYPRNQDLLHVPLLKIGPGEHVALSGENGAGKSTLVKLIARVHDPISGSIQFGGTDIRKVDLANLRKTVCYLPREAVLFEGTILSNLRFVCPEASEDDIEDAIRKAGLSTLIGLLPHGLHERIGPGGCQLSGGERQRVALARALLQRPRVLILDEATSCLDFSAEKMVLENIRVANKTSTLIVISHRSSTVQMFRRVLVLSRGRITHDEKLSTTTITSNCFPAEASSNSHP